MTFGVDNASRKPVCAVRPIDIESVANAQSVCDFLPSWQNSIDSIRRGRANLTMVGAFINDTLAGYSVAERYTGNLTQIAVRREYRRRGVGSLLLRETIKGMATDFIKVLNVSSTDCHLHVFLESHNIALSGKQLDMKLKI